MPNTLVMNAVQSNSGGQGDRANMQESLGEWHRRKAPIAMMHYPAIPVTYWLGQETDVQRAVESLESQFTIHRETRPITQLTYLDTFDWRLHNKGLRLKATSIDGVTELGLESADAPLNCRALSRTPPAFGNDLPPSRLRSLIAPIIEMRRLLPVVCIEARVQLLRVLNADEKTVVRARVEGCTATQARDRNAPRRLPPSLQVLPVKGYDGALHRVVQCLETGLGVRPSSVDRFLKAIEAVGGRPGGYSSKLSLSLDVEMTANEAAKTIHRTLFKMMLANEDGVRHDLDSEFLHDFRVAVRRTRSALGQIKKVFPPEMVGRFQAEFKWLGSVTGPLRDLHVYLLKMDDYRTSLPEAIHGDLGPLQEYLQLHQQSAHRALVDALDSPRYRDLVDSWSEFLDQPAPDDSACPNASLPTGTLASQRIWRIYRRVYKDGSAIQSTTPAEALHALRIECKKLRYLMEFFRSIYPPEDIQFLIAALKQLQDNLGDFNDLEVQQGTLTQFARDMSTEGLASVDTLIAMGRLVEHLHRSQLQERERFDRCFAKFATKESKERCRELFKREGE